MEQYWYGNLKYLRRIFGTKEAGDNFVKWVEEQMSDILRTGQYNRHLAYWHAGVVDTPEASIVRNFIISQAKKSGVSKEDVQRLADAFKDKDLTLLPVVDELFSETDKVLTSYPQTNFDLD